MILCSTQHVLVITLAISSLFHSGCENSEAHRHNDDSVFSYVPCSRESVVKNSVFTCQILMSTGLHDELFQSKGVITNEGNGVSVVPPGKGSG